MLNVESWESQREKEREREGMRDKQTKKYSEIQFILFGFHLILCTLKIFEAKIRQLNAFGAADDKNENGK